MAITYLVMIRIEPTTIELMHYSFIEEIFLLPLVSAVMLYPFALMLWLIPSIVKSYIHI